MAVDREINGSTAHRRQSLRQKHSAQLVVGLATWMEEERKKLSRHSSYSKGHGLYAEALVFVRTFP